MRWALLILAGLLLTSGCEHTISDGDYRCDLSLDWDEQCPKGYQCRPWGVEHYCFDEIHPTCDGTEIEPGEQCDGSHIPQDACEILGVPGGRAICLPRVCVIYCSVCGNGEQELGEQCDGEPDCNDNCEWER